MEKRRPKGSFYQFGLALNRKAWKPKAKPRKPWFSDEDKAWMAAHPCPDLDAPPEVKAQFERGEISRANYLWLCGEDVREDPLDGSARLF